TASTGRLSMQDGAALLRVAGDVTFGGRDTNGLLTAGTIEVGGDFVQRQGQSGCCNSYPRSFQPSGTHTVILNGSGAQLIDFNSGGLAADRSRFANLRVETTGAVTLAGTPAVGGELDIASATTLDGAALLTVAGPLATTTGSALLVDRVVLNGSM